MSIFEILKEGRNNAQIIESKKPLRERVGVDTMVCNAEDKNQIVVIEAQLAMLEKLNKFDRAQDIFSEFSADAAKQLVLEMKTGKTSGDRRKSAEMILSWELGKPLARTANLNLSSTTDLSENELNSEISGLLSSLGFTSETVQTKLLLDDKESKVDQILEGTTGGTKSSRKRATSKKTPIDEGFEEQTEIEKLFAESRLPSEFS